MDTTISFEHHGVRCTLTLIEGQRARWVRGRSVRARATTLFVEEDEGVLDGVAKRHSRPVDLYRDFALAGLRQLLDPAATPGLRWDRHAGCAMCACSPGFFLTDSGRRQVLTDDGLVSAADHPDHDDRYDLWLTIGATVTDYDDVALDRAAQLAADPTLAAIR